MGWYAAVAIGSFISTVAGGILCPQNYPKPVLAKLRAMPPLAITIANRWMRGWPKAVKAQLKSGEYLGFLKEHEEKERMALADPTTHHLAHHEIAELYDLSPAPPLMGT